MLYRAFYRPANGSHIESFKDATELSQLPAGAIFVIQINENGTRKIVQNATEGSNTPEILGFKVWYSDSTFDSTQGTWKDAPRDDIQVVVLYFTQLDALGQPTRRISKGVDYYALDDNGNYTEDFDNISKVKGHILYGKYMDWDKLMEIDKQAFDDYGNGWLIPEVEKPIANKGETHVQPKRWH